MKVLNIHYPLSLQNNSKGKTNFTHRYSDDVPLTLFGKDVNQRLEKAFKNYDPKNEIPKKFIETIKETGNKVLTYFRKDGKTPDCELELSPSNKTLRTTFFDLDGKTKLLEYIAGNDGTERSVYYSPVSGEIIDEHIFKVKNTDK